MGVSIERKEDGTIHMTQPHLIEQILGDLRMLDESVKPRSTPAASSKVLTRHSQSPDFDGSFNYRSVIGKLNYLEKATYRLRYTNVHVLFQNPKGSMERRFAGWLDI